MRRLFLVLAKLLGLIQLYWILSNFWQIGIGLTALFSGLTKAQSVQYVSGIFGWVLYSVVALVAAWILLARTEWLADILRIKDEGEIEKPDKQSLLLVGIKLIGVYVTISAIPRLAGAFMHTREIWGSQINQNIWDNIIPSALQLGLGILLAFYSEKILEIITPKEE